MNIRKIATLMSILWVIASLSCAYAQSAEYLINTCFGGAQQYPAVASNGSTTFVVWQSNGQDGSGNGIYGQVINSDGSMAGPVIRINQTNFSDQMFPEIASDGSNYLVVWSSAQNGGVYADIFTRLYDSAGNPLGDELLINTTQDGNQFFPDVASNGSSFFVVWESWNETWTQTAVYGQYIGLDGQKTGSEVAISAQTGRSHRLPAVATCRNTYLVSWFDATDTQSGTLFAAVYDTQGAQVGDTITVSSPDAHYTMPAIGTNGIDYFLVWASCSDQQTYATDILAQWVSPIGTQLTGVQRVTDEPILDTSCIYMSIASSVSDMLITWHTFNGTDLDICGQLMGTTAIKVGEPFVINTVTGSREYCPEVTNDGSGYVVTWVSNKYDDEGDIFVQKLSRYLQKGDETQVNSTTEHHQQAPAVADSGALSLAVWESYAQTDDHYDIYAQLIDTQGTPAGAEFRLNTYTDAQQRNPSAATDGQRFLAVWESYEQDGDEYGIYAQLIDNDGSFIGDEFIVNTHTDGRQSNPSVRYNGNLYVVVWESYRQNGTISGIYGRLVDNDGSCTGSEFRISDSQQASNPALAVCGDTTCVVWQEYDATDDGSIICAKIVGRDGAPATGILTVSDQTDGFETNPAITANEDRFFVTWQRYIYGEADNDDDSHTGYYIYANAVWPSGNIYGEAQLISQSPALTNADPAVSSDGNDFFITWAQYDNDGAAFDIYGAYYSAILLPVVSEFRINTTTASYQTGPALAASGSTTTVLWESYGQDGSHNDVFASKLHVAFVRNHNYTPYIPQHLLDSFAEDEYEYNFYDVNSDGYLDIVIEEITGDDSQGETHIYWGAETDPYTTYTVINPQGEVVENTGNETSGLVVTNGTMLRNDSMITFSNGYWSSEGTCFYVVEMFPSYDISDLLMPIPVSDYYTPCNIFGQFLSGNGKMIGAEFALSDLTFEMNKPRGASNRNTYLVTWANSGEITARLFNPAGSRIADRLQINSYSTNIQANSCVSTNGVDYCIMWQSDQQDDDGWGVYGKILDFKGATIQSEFNITGHTTDDQINPAIASNGIYYCAVWASEHSDTSQVYYRLFDAEGTPHGGAMLLAVSDDEQINPSIASDGMNFMICWEEDYTIKARLIDYIGSTITDVLTVGAQSDCRNRLPQVTSDGTTYFVVWNLGVYGAIQEFGNTSYGYKYSVVGRVYSSTGVPISAQRQINTYIFGEGPWNPIVQSNGTTYFVSYQGNGYDWSSAGVAGRYFSSHGYPLTREYTINTHVEKTQAYPWVISNGVDYLVSWASNHGTNNDYNKEDLDSQNRYTISNCTVGYDNDGDGYSDRYEIMLGTDPNSADDYFMYNLEVSSDSDIYIYFNELSNYDKEYRLQYTESLDNPQWVEYCGLIAGSGESIRINVNDLPVYIGDIDKKFPGKNTKRGYFRLRVIGWSLDE